MVLMLLDELRMRFRGRRAAVPTQALLDSLFAAGEDIASTDWRGDMFSISPRGQLKFLIHNMLDKWGADADAHLIEAFSRATSAAYLSQVYVDTGRDLGLIEPKSGDETPITPAAFDALGTILRAKISDEALNGRLNKHTFYSGLILAWARLESTEVVHDWLAKEMMNDGTFLAAVGRGLLSETLGTQERHFTLGDGIDRKIFDLETIVRSGKRHLSDPELNSTERLVIQELVRGGEQLLSGRSSEGTRREADD